MTDNKNHKDPYTQGCALFYKKVKEVMPEVKKRAAEREKRKKQAVKDWFYGKREKE